jgi:phosphatidate cytidylyltransferase
MMSLLFGCGALLMVLIHRLHSGQPGTVRADWVKYAVFAGVVISVISVAAWGSLGTALLLAWLAVHGSWELARHLRLSSVRNMLVTTVCSIVVGLLLAHLLMLDASGWWARFVFGFVIVAVTDSFSQLWGRLIGRHRLCPNLSPHKTWEGLCGGMVTAMISTGLLGFLLPGIATPRLMIAGALIALAAIAGDLIFSVVKRLQKIKDFSNLLPGHGGVLDRFDSLVAAAPCIYWIDRLMLH